MAKDPEQQMLNAFEWEHFGKIVERERDEFRNIVTNPRKLCFSINNRHK